GSLADGFGQPLDGHSRDRLLAGGVDVAQPDLVGGGGRGAASGPQRGGSGGFKQMRGSRVTMRLKHDDEPSLQRGSRGGHDRGDLGRVMAVVIDDKHAVDLTMTLEAPFR